MANEDIKDLTLEELEDVAGGFGTDGRPIDLARVLADVNQLGLSKDLARNEFVARIAHMLPGGLADKLALAHVDSLVSDPVEKANVPAAVQHLLQYFDKNFKN